MIIKENLANINRSLIAGQLEVVKDCLKFCNAALYVKLVFDQVRSWKSYTAELMIKKTINDCIGDVFARVENAHGKVLVAAAMAYVTASKSGLGQTEVEDLISIDETVKFSCYYWLKIFLKKGGLILIY